MFEFDAAKLILIGIVALIVIGPKELPRVMRQVGQAIAKIRRMGTEFQSQFMDAMHEADLADIKAEAAKISEAAKLDIGTDPLAGIGASLTREIEARPETELEFPSEDLASEDLTSHADPLATALRKNPDAAFGAVEIRELAPRQEPAPDMPSSLPAQTLNAELELAPKVELEPAPKAEKGLASEGEQELVPEPLRNRG
jgi:sec-independent protein translocase protein TatB